MKPARSRTTPVRGGAGPPLCSPKVPSRLHGRLMARPRVSSLARRGVWGGPARGARRGTAASRQRRQRGRTGRSYLSLGSSLSLSQTQSHGTRARTHIILHLQSIEYSIDLGSGPNSRIQIRDPQVQWLFTPFDAPADFILDPCRSPHGGRLKDPTTRGRAHGPSACPRLGPSISA